MPQTLAPGSDQARSRSQFARSSEFILAGIASVATILLVFVLPLVVPAKPVYGISASYLAGFNNAFAVDATIVLSLLVLLATLRLRRSEPPSGSFTGLDGKLTWRFTTAAILGSSIIPALASLLVLIAHQRYLGDAGYLIEQASTWSETGRRLYSEVEFAYGPLLLLPEIGLARLTHIDITHAYYVIFVAQFALGLVLVAYLLNALPINPRIRQVALVLFALGSITPHLGLNYTFFRFAGPLAFFLFAVRRGTTPLTSACLLSLAVVLECTIAPELALALTAGIVVYACLRAFQAGPTWLLAGVVPALLLAVLLVTALNAYLRMVATFASGIYNLPTGPYPHILLLLFAAVWLVPVYLGRTVSLQSSTSAQMLGFYTIALAMLPAALHRCDPLHVFFNGFGFFLLSLVAVRQWAPVPRRAAIGCLALLVLWEHRVNEGLFAWRTAQTVQLTVLPHTPGPLRPFVIALTALPDRHLVAALKKPPGTEHLPDMPTLDRLLGTDQVAVPFEIPPALEQELKTSRHYSPLYYAFAVDMMDQRAEQNAIDALGQFHWMLLPTKRHLAEFQQFPKDIGPIQGIRTYFRQRNPVLYTPGQAFEVDLARNWRLVAVLGSYSLYRRNTAF